MLRNFEFSHAPPSPSLHSYGLRAFTPTRPSSRTGWPTQGGYTYSLVNKLFRKCRHSEDSAWPRAMGQAARVEVSTKNYCVCISSRILECTLAASRLRPEAHGVGCPRGNKTATGRPPAGRRRVGHGRPQQNFRDSMTTLYHTPMLAHLGVTITGNVKAKRIVSFIYITHNTQKATLVRLCFD
jgi:hypothetical protein